MHPLGAGPPADLTPLAQGAAGLHELFSAYVSAGFTREEALRIILELLRASGGAS